jgi:hypothetical protein
MQSSFLLLSRLLPALAGAPDSVPVSPGGAGWQAPVPLTGSLINWGALEERLMEPDTARTRQRSRAVEYSDFYHVRLTLHCWLSFAMIPLFVGSYVTGDQVLRHSSSAPDWALNWHRPLATATAIVFTANTITGLWNLWDSRRDPAGRLKRYVHSMLFIAADAGFTYAGTTLARDARQSDQKRRQHRDVALVSMGISLTGWSMMLFFK